MEFDFYQPIFVRLPSLKEIFKDYSREETWFLFSDYLDVDDYDEED